MRLIGHRRVTEPLLRLASQGRLPHALLLTGPASVGRRTVAVALAQALNCQAPRDQRPCGACRACRLIERGVHPDVRQVRRAPDRRFILLKPGPSSSGETGFEDNVLFIQADAVLRPVDGRAKVYVILEAESLLPEAANRLLKTLEEPPPTAHFILTAADRGAVLPTIASRCQEVPLRPVPRAELAAALETEAGLQPEAASALAAASGGLPGWALRAARDPSLLANAEADRMLLERALGPGRLERLVVARSLAERWGTRPDTVRATLRTWGAWLRDALLARVEADGPAREAGAPRRNARTPGGAAARLAPAAIASALLLVEQARADLDANINARLALDNLLLHLPGAPG